MTEGTLLLLQHSNVFCKAIAQEVSSKKISLKMSINVLGEEKSSEVSAHWAHLLANVFHLFMIHELTYAIN